MERYEFNKFSEEYKKKMDDLYQAFNIEKKEAEMKVLDEKINSADFWSNQKEAQSVIASFNAMKDVVVAYRESKAKYDDINEMADMAFEDPDMMELLVDEIEVFKKTEAALEEKALLSGKYDFNNCIMELHPGAGGTESMDWASMLFRMYQRYCQNNGLKFNVVDYQPGDEAGIKSCVVMIEGPYAYGLLKSERGVHRLVRISPFDSNSRRHTSFCSCDIAPEIKEADDIVIPEEDLRVDTFCSSGPGGQGVNTTYSAVRVTHIPTGLFVASQQERSQIRNKEIAMTLLKSKLMDLEIKRQEEELASEKGEQMNINFGSQIRSYVFCPYTLVKDHRTNFEVGNIESVMNGGISGFIEAYLKENAKKSA